jgi:hypothetical protein
MGSPPAPAELGGDGDRDIVEVVALIGKQRLAFGRVQPVCGVRVTAERRLRQRADRHCRQQAGEVVAIGQLARGAATDEQDASPQGRGLQCIGDGEAGAHTLTAADPLPDDLRRILASIHDDTSGAH